MKNAEKPRTKEHRFIIKELAMERNVEH